MGSSVQFAVDVGAGKGQGARGSGPPPAPLSERPPLPPVLFHMYDSDSDGRITLEEYRNVKYAPRPARAPGAPAPCPAARTQAHGPPSLPGRQVVEELLSGNPHIEKESARSIADGAMMEAASVCVGQMVSALLPLLAAV